MTTPTTELDPQAIADPFARLDALWNRQQAELATMTRERDHWRRRTLDLAASLQAAAGYLEDIYSARTTTNIPSMALRALNDVRAALARSKGGVS